LISLLSFSTISVGVFLGAPIPCQGEALVRNPARTCRRMQCRIVPTQAATWSCCGSRAIGMRRHGPPQNSCQFDFLECEPADGMCAAAEKGDFGTSR
jgi:hypothetical protein